jgi:hypothetical protein
MNLIFIWLIIPAVPYPMGIGGSMPRGITQFLIIQLSKGITLPYTTVLFPQFQIWRSSCIYYLHYECGKLQRLYPSGLKLNYIPLQHGILIQFKLKPGWNIQEWPREEGDFI